MKVAVIGAGIAGLACAHELEMYGIEPVIFEQKNKSGDLFDHCGATLELFTRPHDPLEYMKNNFSITIKPLQTLKTIIMNSPSRTATIKGNLGYLILRGQHEPSAETQLHCSVKSKVNFNNRANYAELAREYEHVVVANGTHDVSRTLGTWSAVYQTHLIGANVLGQFDIEAMIMWINTRFAKNAYAYLTPIEKNRAFLGLVVPDSTPDQAREHWKLFWEIEKLPWDIVFESMVEHVSGFVYPHQIDNILLAGTAGGFLEPFLGFGLLSSAQSGVLAGRAIATGKKYEELLQQLKEDMKHSLAFRKMFSNLGNADMDRLIAILGTTGIKQFIYNTNIDLVRITTAVAGKIQKYLNN
jgi:flavin-dependent dehydrogenase